MLAPVGGVGYPIHLRLLGCCWFKDLVFALVTYCCSQKEIFRLLLGQANIRGHL